MNWIIILIAIPICANLEAVCGASYYPRSTDSNYYYCPECPPPSRERSNVNGQTSSSVSTNSSPSAKTSGPSYRSSAPYNGPSYTRSFRSPPSSSPTSSNDFKSKLVALLNNLENNNNINANEANSNTGSQSTINNNIPVYNSGGQPTSYNSNGQPLNYNNNNINYNNGGQSPYYNTPNSANNPNGYNSNGQYANYNNGQSHAYNQQQSINSLISSLGAHSNPNMQPMMANMVAPNHGINNNQQTPNSNIANGQSINNNNGNTGQAVNYNNGYPYDTSSSMGNNYIQTPIYDGPHTCPHCMHTTNNGYNDAGLVNTIKGVNEIGSPRSLPVLAESAPVMVESV